MRGRKQTGVDEDESLSESIAARKKRRADAAAENSEQAEDSSEKRKNRLPKSRKEEISGENEVKIEKKTSPEDENEVKKTEKKAEKKKTVRNPVAAEPEIEEIIVSPAGGNSSEKEKKSGKKTENPKKKTEKETEISEKKEERSEEKVENFEKEIENSEEKDRKSSEKEDVIGKVGEESENVELKKEEKTEKNEEKKLEEKKESEEIREKIPETKKAPEKPVKESIFSGGELHPYRILRLQEGAKRRYNAIKSVLMNGGAICLMMKECEIFIFNEKPRFMMDVDSGAVRLFVGKDEEFPPTDEFTDATKKTNLPFAAYLRIRNDDDLSEAKKYLNKAFITLGATYSETPETDFAARLSERGVSEFLPKKR